MANNADSDQLASSEPIDLDLHCLQRQDISGFSRTRVKQRNVFWCLKSQGSEGRHCKKKQDKVTSGSHINIWHHHKVQGRVNKKPA